MADTENLSAEDILIIEQVGEADEKALAEKSHIELFNMCALDPIFFGHMFFPKAFRQKSPQMHYDMANLLVSAQRHIGFMVFRGGAKTTVTRNTCAHGMSYGLYRTILFVSEAQDHSIRSVKWVKNAVDYNRRWADFYGLEPKKDIRTGRPVKWTDEWIIVHHKFLGIDISLIALGIHGQTRGLNIDDFRPDLIVVDDPSDEENTKTSDARRKTSDVFFGALEKSLAPITENPMAKIVLLQTPIVEQDLIMQCTKDPQFKCVVFGCFDENGKSRWEDRFPTEQLLKDKESHVARNMTKLWMREMECKVIADDTTAFRAGWLNTWKEDTLPQHEGFVIVSVDPTPPPKDWTKEPTRELDDAIVQAWRFTRNGRYLLSETAFKSPDPDQLIYEIFNYVIKYKPIDVAVETVLFARYLKYYIEKEMRRRNIFFALTPVEDKRNKTTRIIQALKGPASLGMIYIHESHSGFREQFETYPYSQKDDRLDAASIAFIRADALTGGGMLLEGTAELLELAPLEYKGACP